MKKDILSKESNSILDDMIQSNRYDSLTGLPNMAFFFELAESGKTIMAQQGEYAALLFFDLSGMKIYNNKFGFAEGDNLLKSFGTLISEYFGKDNCSHLGQDHFGVYTNEKNLENRLNDLFSKWATRSNGKFLHIHTGIYSIREEDVPINVACDRAKIACDVLKGKLESSFNYFDNELKIQILKRQYILENIDKAIESDWIQVYYQPIIRAINGKVCSEEALARWVDPEKGMLSPDEFIPYLEDANLIYKLDLRIVELVLEKMQYLKEKGYSVVSNSINLSRSDFASCDIVEEIRKRVDATEIPREKINIEITESIIGADFDFMKLQIERFQNLGFPVWMDDFGSGYSSMDALQSIDFDLLKFDMSFMQRLDEGGNGKIVLTELIKMATSLGFDVVCEGVETEAQVKFLQEIGCSKLQGYHFCQPISMEDILRRYETGTSIGFENPKEADYYEAVGRVNLYDFDVLAKEDTDDFYNFFNTLPMGIIEVNGDKSRFVRSNQSYRDFIKRFFGIDLSREGTGFEQYSDSFMHNVVRICCEQGLRSFYDEKMPNGSVVHSFARRIGTNPANGNIAVAIAVLSITDVDEGTTYAEIARALAADYYNIYYVDLETEKYIEYSSMAGEDDMAFERHGNDFFTSARQETMTRIYEEDREYFLSIFTKENIIHELEQQSVFNSTYRLVDTGKPVYASMKITKLHPTSHRIIIGISIIDSQMKQQALIEKIRKDYDTLSKIMALNENYLGLYIVNPETGRYIENTSTEEYASLGIDKTGEDFFGQSVENIKKAIHPDDLPVFLEKFSKDNIMEELSEKGVFMLKYRLIFNGKAKPVLLRIAPFKDGADEKLFASVREWRTRE